MKLRLWIAIVWTSLILIACWLPRSQMPVSEGAPSLLKLIHFDKIVHAGLFAGFAFLWRRATSASATSRILAIGLALAVVTELGQATSWVGRDADVWDGLADAVGVLIGLGGFAILDRRMGPRQILPP